jgi:spore coat polysaccharide biosynthesis protein SpsF
MKSGGEMKQFSTEQEAFWAGDFGNEYLERNQGEYLLASNTVLFSRILARTDSVKSIIEFGANRGMNILALRRLLSQAEYSAIEINENAVKSLESIGDIKIYHQSILDFEPDIKRDFVLIKGVLIHINPECLSSVYNKLYETSNRYICVTEYYNPKPVEVLYRGHEGKLFKRDFAGEMMDRFSDLHLVDYGFVYNRDNNFADDDFTWFLMEKR